MRIAVVGEDDHWDECRQKFGERNTFIHLHEPPRALTVPCDVVFDFTISPDRGGIKGYSGWKVPLFLNTAKASLSSLSLQVEKDIPPVQFGFAGLRTFLNRPVLEVSLHQRRNLETLTTICLELQTDFQVVEDCAGLFTPRVICMIINEAYYTVADGIATRQDVDLAMKLGTNYPFGPFEWCRKIGVKDVCELLASVQRETGNPRYKICPLLRQEYDALPK
jgi:3-hydroxybutyryl-CoA dehydrogenase